MEKILSSLIKPKFVKKKLISNTLLVEVPKKKNFLGPITRTVILSQPKNTSLPLQLPEFVKGCSEKHRSLPLHFRQNKK